MVGAVQVDLIKPTLKAPKTKLLKQTNDELLSSFSFKFHLRRYSTEGGRNSVAADGRFTVSKPRTHTDIGSCVYGYRVRFVQI